MPVLFTRAIDGLSTDHFSQNCIKCHAVGFDANTNAANGGFDDVAKSNRLGIPDRFHQWQLGRHAGGAQERGERPMRKLPRSGQRTRLSRFGNPNFITVTVASGDCAQCHDSLTPPFEDHGMEQFPSCMPPRVRIPDPLACGVTRPMALPNSLMANRR
jgi:hypothetical protein